jgi:hypothetical protein
MTRWGVGLRRPGSDYKGTYDSEDVEESGDVCITG